MIEIPLTGGHIAKIDDCDADLAAHHWWATRNGRNHVYAQRKVGGKNLYLHRAIGERLEGDGPSIDHINGDTLDNTRANLRRCTHRENIRNRRGANHNSASGIRGVRLYKPLQKWAASISVPDASRPRGQRLVHLGYFATAEEATKARKDAEERLWS